MPKNSIDFQKTIIYKLVCNDVNITQLYVGSTTEFTKRKYQHKSDCKNENSIAFNDAKYKFIRENGGWAGWSMIQVEAYPCTNSLEARSRERYWVETLSASLNTHRPISSVEEKKEYYEVNKKYFKEYYENTIKTKRIKCDCGCEYISTNKAYHMESNKHKKLLKQIEDDKFVEAMEALNNEVLRITDEEIKKINDIFDGREVKDI